MSAALGTPFALNDIFGAGRSDEARTIRDVQERAFLDLQRGRALPPHLALLSPEARVAVGARWTDVCEALFEYLAANFPGDLLNLVTSGILAPPATTFAAEIAGRLSNSEAVRTALLPLLDHERALVREGAVYGLREHADSAVVARLRWLAEHDASPGVRQAAHDTLDEL